MSRIYFELNVALKKVSKMIWELYQSHLRSDLYFKTLPEVSVVIVIVVLVVVVVVVVIAVVAVVVDEVVVVDNDIVHGS